MVLWFPGYSYPGDILYCWSKLGKYKTYNKIRQANLLQVLSKEGVEGSKRCTFSHCKPFIKQKNGVAYKAFNSEFTERTWLYTFKISWEVLESWWKHYWSNKVKVIIHKPPEKWERLKRTTFSLKDNDLQIEVAFQHVSPTWFRHTCDCAAQLSDYQNVKSLDTYKSTSENIVYTHLLSKCPWQQVSSHNVFAHIHDKEPRESIAPV